MLKVAKFGGSSLAGAEQFRKVKEIIEADPSRMCVVVSAAGKRNKKDSKITDLLYLTHAHINYGVSHEDIFSMIEQRYYGIRDELGLTYDLESEFDRLRSELDQDISVDYLVSRGEYLTARLMSEYLGYGFLDAAKCVIFSYDGQIDYEKTYQAIAEKAVKMPRFVMPGFYGSLPNGRIRCMTRGGSDISGAIVARAAQADIYENWTDVSGFLMADPRVVENPRPIDTLTYRELRELSYMGATVLHEDAIFPVHKAGIPTVIKNTNAPQDPGTMIVTKPTEASYKSPITGIAGHKDFTLISIEKAMMNSELGFGRRVLQALEDFGVSFEHLPTGIDTMCVVISDRELSMTKTQIINRIQETCHPDSIEISGGLALIATVGYGMVKTRGTAAKLFAALSDANVNVRMIDQGSSELNIIVGVDVDDFETALRAIYNAFVQ